MRNQQPVYTMNFGEIGLKDISRVGGKNASLGELFNSFKAKGVGVIDGFATTADAYRAMLAEGELEYELRSLVSDFDYENVEELKQRGRAARIAVLDMPLPKPLRCAIIAAYEQLCHRLGHEPELAVRSSATAEDLPEASFAGAAETFLNVRGREALLRAVHLCFASLFTDRAISYRARLGYDQLSVAISVGVQPMVRVVRETAELNQVETGDVLVAGHTDPDWEPVMRRVPAIVTDTGGRTAHAAITRLGLTKGSER